MSYYFNIQSDESVSYLELADKLEKEEIRFSNDTAISDKPIQWTKIYIPFKSTRGVTIKYENNSYSIGINVIASEYDFKLAILVAKSIAKISGNMIFAESLEEPIHFENIDSQFNDTWIDDMKTLGVNIFLENIGEKNQVLSIGGCYMNYFVGPKIHETLDNSTDLNYYKSLVKHIQNTQFFDLNKYRIPNTITVTSEETSETKEIVVFSNFSNQFYPKSDIIVFKSGDERYEIPYSEIKNVQSSLIQFIDEEQFLVSEIDDLGVENIFDQIRKIHLGQNIEIAIDDKVKGDKINQKQKDVIIRSQSKETPKRSSSELKSKRKWWEFWK